jgi:hypothetical protein
VAGRFTREAPVLRPLPARRYDTAYWTRRQVGWDAYVEVRGNRYSVPAEFAGQLVTVRLSLEGQLSVYDGDHLVAQHVLQPADRGSVRISTFKREDQGHSGALRARTAGCGRLRGPSRGSAGTPGHGPATASGPATPQ